MQNNTTKKRKKLPVIVSILIVLVLLTVAGLSFILLGGKDLFAKPPAPYFATDQVEALLLEPSADAVTQSDWETYFSEAVDFASSNGFNTILFNGKTELPVYWRDAHFPVPDAVGKNDGLFRKLDPLALLCEAAQGKNIQVWLAVDPYASGGFSSSMKGSAVSLAIQQASAMHQYFSPTDQEYAKLFTKSMARLPLHYPLAGVVLTNLNQPAGASYGLEPAQQALQQLAADISAEWQNKGYATRLSLGFQDENTSLVTAAGATALASGGSIQYTLPGIAGSQALSTRIQPWDAAGKFIAVPQPEQNATLLFTASRFTQFSGTLFGGFASAKASPQRIGNLRSALQPAEGTLPVGFIIPQSLAVNYPKDGAKIYTDALFIMGNSDPSLPLYLDGAEITHRAAGGAFGVEVPIVTGANSFTFTQGEATQTLTVNRPAPSGGGGSSAPMPHDATKEAAPGQAVQVKGVFASALTDYTNDSKMNETFYTDAIAIVQENVETVRYNSSTGRNEKTFAYKLTSGDYILAKQCNLLDSPGTSSFTGIRLQPAEGGELLIFEGSGTPAAYLSNENNQLKVTMYDTAFSLPGGFSSELVKSASVEPIPGGVVLTLQVPSLWGYSIEYSGGETRLYLNSRPSLGADPLKPLQGVRIMLDPGHGGEDMGAPGVMGELRGPNEKDINLALAQAIAYRLRQLGAEVIMVRDEDIYIGTLDRLAMQIEAKPDFFLSVHHNSANLDRDRNNAIGVQSFYFIPGNYSAPLSAKYAQTLLDKIAASTGRPGSEAGWGYYNVIRTPVCPSVLFEYGFMISPAEFEDIASTDGIYSAAVATADAFIAMLEPS